MPKSTQSVRHKGVCVQQQDYSTKSKKILGNVTDYQQPHFLPSPKYVWGGFFVLAFFLEYSQRNTIEDFQSRKRVETEKTATILV